ncbi:MAG TPA: SRPBCC family protein [Anaerolineales bacterium]
MPNFRLNAEPGKQDITITYEFNAPASRVFKAMTDPKLLEQWWGPRIYTTVVDKLEPRAGGQWRFINRAADGGEHGFHGVFHLVEPDKRIVQTFEYEGAPGHVSLESMTLEERGGKTSLIAHSVFQSPEDRAGMMVDGGMEAGARETYARLDELLERA